MAKSKNKIVSQKNKNNKTKPENLMKKEYLESYEELKKSITNNRKTQERKDKWTYGAIDQKTCTRDAKGDLARAILLLTTS